MPNDQLIADFRHAAHQALGTIEVIEYLAQQQLNGQPFQNSTLARAQNTLRPVGEAMFAIYRSTGRLPRLSFRGFIFTLSIMPGGIVDLQLIRQSDIIDVG